MSGRLRVRNNTMKRLCICYFHNHKRPFEFMSRNKNDFDTALHPQPWHSARWRLKRWQLSTTRWQTWLLNTRQTQDVAKMSGRYLQYLFIRLLSVRGKIPYERLANFIASIMLFVLQDCASLNSCVETTWIIIRRAFLLAFIFLNAVRQFLYTPNHVTLTWCSLRNVCK